MRESAQAAAGDGRELARKAEEASGRAAAATERAVKEAEAMMERVRTNMALRFGARRRTRCAPATVRSWRRRRKRRPRC